MIAPPPPQQAREAALITYILKRVQRSTGVAPSTMLHRRRSESASFARHLAVALIRASSNLSLQEIGSVFRRHHGTVINSCERIANRRSIDPKFDQFYRTVLHEITVRFANHP